MQLTELTIDSYSTLKPFYNKLRLEASELCFTNLFMWRHKYNFYYVIVGQFLWICNMKNDSTYYFSQPIGNYADTEELKASIDQLKDFLSEKNMHLIIKKADMQFVKALENASIVADIQEDRNSFDYIYDFTELKVLSGNKFHKKKNHINKFLKTVPEYTYHPLTEETLPLLLNSYDIWFEENQKEGLEQDYKEEKHAIEEALHHFEKLSFTGAIIEIDGKVEAYTLGESLNDDTVVIHIEKANMSIPGLYPFINQQYLQHLDDSVKWVNREQDLGLEGLRKAKLSYHPAFFIEKFVVRF